MADFSDSGFSSRLDSPDRCSKGLAFSDSVGSGFFSESASVTEVLSLSRGLESSGLADFSDSGFSSRLGSPDRCSKGLAFSDSGFSSRLGSSDRCSKGLAFSDGLEAPSL